MLILSYYAQKASAPSLALSLIFPYFSSINPLLEETTEEADLDQGAIAEDIEMTEMTAMVKVTEATEEEMTEEDPDQEKKEESKEDLPNTLLRREVLTQEAIPGKGKFFGVI